ncbi:MAG: hypothetical protein ACI9PN_000478, partial [Candidatus Azotimanducaceae bacterium]
LLTLARRPFPSAADESANQTRITHTNVVVCQVRRGSESAASKRCLCIDDQPVCSILVGLATKTDKASLSSGKLLAQ